MDQYLIWAIVLVMVLCGIATWLAPKQWRLEIPHIGGIVICLMIFAKGILG